MPFPASQAVGLIEMKPASSRLEPFVESETERDCAGELASLARSPARRTPEHDFDGDALLYADTEQLAEDLEREYRTVRTAIDAARKKKS